MRFTKAQATGNDFVMITDQRGDQDIDSELVARLCDRHFGIGADGLIRAVPVHHSAEARELSAELDVVSSDDAPVWFMDYRNGDGSVAEMCGNGVRAFAHYLIAEGLAVVPDGGSLQILSRAGLKNVRLVKQGYAVDMGVWGFIDPELASSRASDSLVQASGVEDPRPALSITMGNPHTVVALGELDALTPLDLSRAPLVEPTPPNGTNVEFVVPEDPLVSDGVGRVQMRVHERGVGETLSCGTGACAAAAAVRVWAADAGVDRWTVTVPGGDLSVTFLPRPDGAEDVELAGPAEVVYSGEFPLS